MLASIGSSVGASRANAQFGGGQDVTGHQLSDWRAYLLLAVFLSNKSSVSTRGAL